MDQITAKSDDARSWAKASEGQAQCVLVDVIDLGLRQESYMGGPPKMQHKCALVWQIDEENPDTGRPFEMSKEFTVSMGEKANLRKFLGMWRGKSYTDAEATEGAPLHKLYAVNGLMQIEHKQSKSNPDRTYANILSVSTLPKKMAPIQPSEYTRSDHWKEKIGVAQQAEQTGNGGSDDEPPYDESGAFEDEMPF